MDLSQFLTTGSVKTISLNTGTIRFETTGVKLSASVSATRKAIFILGDDFNVEGDIVIKFGDRTVYSGDAREIISFPMSVPGATGKASVNLGAMQGGKGEDLEVSCSTAGEGGFAYSLQIVETD